MPPSFQLKDWKQEKALHPIKVAFVDMENNNYTKTAAYNSYIIQISLDSPIMKCSALTDDTPLYQHASGCGRQVTFAARTSPLPSGIVCPLLTEMTVIHYLLEGFIHCAPEWQTLRPLKRLTHCLLQGLTLTHWKDLPTAYWKDKPTTHWNDISKS